MACAVLKPSCGYVNNKTSIFQRDTILPIHGSSLKHIFSVIFIITAHSKTELHWNILLIHESALFKTKYTHYRLAAVKHKIDALYVNGSINLNFLGVLWVLPLRHSSRNLQAKDTPPSASIEPQTNQTFTDCNCDAARRTVWQIHCQPRNAS
jgi:hypothetical protein